MNSRGKPLTTFEHFKAEFEQKLHLFNHELAEEIERKIDIKWTDFLWKYKDESCLVDPMFLNYFKFVCDLIELKSGGTLQGRGYDEFELLDLYFDPSNPNIDFEYNVNFIKNSLDALCDFNGNLLTDLFEQYLSLESRDDKAKISYNNIDLLKDCFYNYVDTKTGQRDYQFGKMFLLYSFLLYCQNKTNISNEDFRERIRIINNLILNSEDELNDRATNSRLPGIVEQTESIVINGIILNRDGLNGFNAKQIEEEIEKQKWRKEHQDSIAALNRLENHDLLFGQIYIVGLDNINIFDKFTELFKCNKDLVSCALLTICDYSRVEKGWRYTFGTESNNASWVFLFHKSNALGDDKTTRALVGLLNSMDVINDSTLKSICDAYLSSCEQNNTFDWRYYFIKYPEFRPNKFGRYEVHENDFYTMHAFATKQKASENSYKPFLKIIDCNNNHLDPTKNGSRLVFGDKYIYCTSNGFELREEDGVTVVDRRTVDQIDGIDVENRVDMYLANPFTSI